MLICPSLLPQTPSSWPHMLRQRSPGPALRKPAGSVPHSAPPPALPRWGAGWVYVGRQCWPALPFPPSHPKATGQATPPLSLSCFPGQVHPGHSLPGVRVPHSSGFTPPQGGLGFLHGG